LTRARPAEPKDLPAPRAVNPADRFDLKAAVGETIGSAIGNKLVRFMMSGHEGGGGRRACAQRLSAL
jgi:hypothetical protein